MALVRKDALLESPHVDATCERVPKPPKTMRILGMAVLLISLFASEACKRVPVVLSSTPKPFKPSVRFQAYDGSPPKFAEMTFQINAGGRAEFLKLGDIIPNTTIRLSDFDPVTEELIIIDTTTSQRARLSRPKPVDSARTF